MSCCGGNCRCGSGCSCGGGCKMFPDLTFSGEKTVEIMIAGVAHRVEHLEGVEMKGGYETEGCNCGGNCSCDPCTCK